MTAIAWGIYTAATLYYDFKMVSIAKPSGGVLLFGIGIIGLTVTTYFELRAH